MKTPHVLGILPARGGSKGIPGKNLRKLCGRPLISWAADSIVNSPSVARAICTTDDKNIAQVALDSGLEVPFLRPKNLATDTALIVDVILHALDVLDNFYHPFTHVALVQATTPTVTVNDVEAAIDLVRSNTVDTVISGFQAGMHHPSIMYTLDEQEKVAWLSSSNSQLRRQDLPTVYIRTGIVYICSTTVLRNRRSLYGDHIRALVVEESRSVTIDAEPDFLRAEMIMEQLSG